MSPVSASFGAALILASSAMHAEPVADFFNGLDTDNDGKLSLQESASHADLITYFSTLDADQNGYLTPQEFGVEPESRGSQTQG